MKRISKTVIAIIAVAIVVIGAATTYYYMVMLRPAGRIMVYGAIHEFEIERLLRAFTEDTGIEAEFIRMSAGEILARIRAEKAAPKGDIFLGGPCLYHMIAQEEGLLERYVSPEGAKYDPVFKSKPEGYWYGFYLGAIGFACNKKLFEEKGLDYPKTWDDLLKPEFKGEIIYAYAYTSGTSYTIVATILQLKGEEEGWKYLEKLEENVLYHTKSGAAPARLAAAGEVMIGISFGHDILKPIAAGYKVVLIYPEDGTGYEIGAVSIIKGGPNTEAAKAFIDWMLGLKAAQLHTDLSFRISTLPGVIMRPGTVPLEDIKLIEYDFIWAAENYDRIVEEWKKRIEKA